MAPSLPPSTDAVPHRAARGVPPLPIGRTALWMVFFLSWTVQGLLHALTPMPSSRHGGITMLLMASADVVQAALLTAVCYSLASGVLARRFAWARVVVAILAAAAGLPLARLLYLTAVHRAFGVPLPLRTLVFGAPGESLVTAGFLGLGFTVAYAVGAQARELNVSRLEGELAQARLQALQAQLHPHFLFNAFNSIAALMHRDVDAADRMLSRLGELLRHVLRRSSAQFVTLGEELEFIELYLEIERTRFRERLDVRVRVDDDARSAVVPNLILQPLVENAIRHGIAPVAAGGVLEISALPDGDALDIEVRDSGRGLPRGWTPTKVGVGLTNVRGRLEHLYGPRHTFLIESPPAGGVRVHIRIPLDAPPDDDPEYDRSAD